MSATPKAGKIPAKKVPTMFSKDSSAKLAVNGKSMLHTVVMSGEGEQEMARALQCVQCLLEQEPVGTAASLLEMEWVKTSAKQKANTGPLMFGGTYDMIDFERSCVPGHLNASRISHVLEHMTTVGSVTEQLGTVKINVDMWSQDGYCKLPRGNKDAEIAAVNLMLYWHRGETTTLKDKLWLALSDLAFDARSMGTGCTFKMKVFEEIDAENKARDVVGLSAANTCKFLADMALDALKTTPIASPTKNAAVASASGEPEVASTEDLSSALHKVFANAKSLLAKEWKSETIARYLSIGHRLCAPGIPEVITQWEFTNQRNTLIDGITVLRACVGAAQTDIELLTLLKTLFLEQNAGIRLSIGKSSRSKSNLTPYNICRSILVRRQVFVHVQCSMPNHAQVVEPFLDLSAFAKYFGIDACGRAIEGFVPPSFDDHDDDDDDVNNLGSSSGASTFKSKPLLEGFCRKLLKGTFETTFVSMIVESRKDASSSVQPLNLTLAAAAKIKATINHMVALYAEDFPVVPASPIDVEHVVHQSTPDSAPILVKVETTIKSNEEYQAKLKEWQQKCADDKDSDVMTYINARLQFVVDSGADPENRAKKVQAY